MAQSLEILSSWLEKRKTSKWRQLALYSDLLPQSFEAWGSIPIPAIAVNKKPHKWLRAYLQHARCSRTNVFIETPYIRDERACIQWNWLFQTLIWKILNGLIQMYKVVCLYCVLYFALYSKVLLVEFLLMIPVVSRNLRNAMFNSNIGAVDLFETIFLFVCHMQ